MQCATTGDYNHPEFENMGSWSYKFGMTSPTVARMGTYYMTSDMVGAMKEDLMT